MSPILPMSGSARRRRISDARIRAPLGALTLIVVGLTVACGDGTTAGGDGGGEPTPAADEGSAATPLDFLRDREVLLPQFAGGDDGALYVAWQEPAAERGTDLYVARRPPEGAFSAPVRVNDISGDLGGGSLDEGRPALAVGANGVFAVAWSARGGDIRAALSRDGGAGFAPSVALNSDAGTRAYRGFVNATVDGRGVVHAVWIDGRYAPPGAEEPAELFYARVDGDQVTEINLTEGQEDSICGCCRPDIDARADGGLQIAFRNTGGGYRDIFRLEATPDGSFGEAARLGPPMWELNGCPVIGPLNVGEATLWAEASTGKRRILVATEPGGDYGVVVEDDDEWAIERPPRRVVGSRAGEPLLLVPGRPTGRILRGAGAVWETVLEDVPRWAMSAALVDGRLLFVGSIGGELQATQIDADLPRP